MKYDFSGFDEETKDQKEFDFSGFDEETTKPQVSKTESITRGALQGGTLNFADEISGAAEALWNVAKGDPRTFGELYRTFRDESRKNFKTAEEANPNSYLAGEIAGGVGSSVALPLRAATLAGKAAQATGLGAAIGLGHNEKDEDLVKDVALSGAIGGLSVPILEGAGNLVKKGFEKAASTADEHILPKAGKAIFGVDERATQNYLNDRATVNKAPTLGELADQVLSKADDGSTINQLKDKVSKMSSESWETLSPGRSIPKKDLLQAIDDGQSSLLIGDNLVGASQTKAHNTLENFAKQIVNFSEELDEPTIKRLIQNLDENINWNNPEAGVTNEQLRSLRTYLDQRLKKQNPRYADQMKKTEESVRALEEVKKVFQNRLSPENYDKFIKATKHLVNKDELNATSQAVDKIKEHTGYDLRKDITNSWTKTQFQKGDPNGSRKTLLGGVLGSAAGLGSGNPLLGGAVGSAAGFTVDKYSGPIFKKMLDGRINASEFNEKLAPILGKFSKPLEEALRRGPSALAVTHYLLQKSNPEYRTLTKELDDE